MRARLGAARYGEAKELSVGDSTGFGNGTDPYDLARFVDAQEHDYDQALFEIRSGRKRSHWIWYIFPQFEGLGFSTNSRRYSIKSLAEAEAYLSHPLLGPRLREICEAAVVVEGRSAFEIFGSPDEAKLKSCATLFASVSQTGSVFDRLLEKYFEGRADLKTLRLLGSQGVLGRPTSS